MMDSISWSVDKMRGRKRITHYALLCAPNFLNILFKIKHQHKISCVVNILHHGRPEGSSCRNTEVIKDRDRVSHPRDLEWQIYDILAGRKFSCHLINKLLWTKLHKTNGLPPILQDKTDGLVRVLCSFLSLWRENAVNDAMTRHERTKTEPYFRWNCFFPGPQGNAVH